MSLPAPKIIIFGATHLGITLANILATQHPGIWVIDKATHPPELPKGWHYQPGDYVIPEHIDELAMVYAVTNEDQNNIRIALVTRNTFKTLPICISLVQYRLGEKLARHLDNFSFFCPSQIAARKFIEAISTPLPANSSLENLIETPKRVYEDRTSFRLEPIVYQTVLAFCFLALLASIYFHLSEHLSWIDSLYFVITLMTTVGFGDITLKNSSTFSKLMGIILMLASVLTTSAIVALMTDSLIKYRLLSFGRWRIKESNHIIVVGIGSVGYRVVEELVKQGESVVVIEQEAHGRHMPAIYSTKVPVIIGDGRSGHILRNAGLMRAKAILSLTNDDLTNLEVGLSAKYYHPHLRVVLRIYDHLLAQSLDQRLDIHLAFSMSSVAASVLAKVADPLIKAPIVPSIDKGEGEL